MTNVEQESAHVSRRESNVTSQGNNKVASVIMFLLLFGLFAGGLYVMGLYTIEWWLFVVGLTMSMLSLFITWSVIPRYLT